MAVDRNTVGAYPMVVAISTDTYARINIRLATVYCVSTATLVLILVAAFVFISGIVVLYHHMIADLVKHDGQLLVVLGRHV
jgi:hypothetical protein